VVFLDYQNVYRGARDRLQSEAAKGHVFGQIDPLALGLHLAARAPGRVLTQVRVYRGRPEGGRDPKAHKAFTRQLGVWDAKRPDVEAVVRDLRYPRPWPNPYGWRPQEKGIDVALAVDFVTMAVEGDYEVGILMSTDTDLLPAVEFVHRRQRQGGPRVEVAAWTGPQWNDPRLSVRGGNVWCHWLDLAAYEQVADRTDYSARR
jgi:NYN domain